MAKRTISRKINAQLSDVIDFMLEDFEQCVLQAELIADQFDQGSLHATGAYIHQFLNKAIQYRADNFEQKIKTPYRFMLDGYGDCKSYSLFAASVLYSLGYNVAFIYSTSSNPDQPDHVYVLAGYDFESVYLDGTIPDFNAEPFYINKWIKELP